MIDRIFIQKIKDLGDKRDMNFREEPEIRSSNHQTTEQLTVQTSASHLNIHACNTLNLIDSILHKNHGHPFPILDACIITVQNVEKFSSEHGCKIVVLMFIFRVHLQLLREQTFNLSHS